MCQFLTAESSGSTSGMGKPRTPVLTTVVSFIKACTGESQKIANESVSTSSVPAAAALPTQESAVTTLLQTSTKLNTIPEFELGEHYTRQSTADKWQRHREFLKNIVLVLMV